MSRRKSTATALLWRPLWAGGAALFISVLALLPPATVRAETPPPHYTGWAVEAYPEASAAEMEAMVQRMVNAGANIVWIGHNNPGEVDEEKLEPGLSYAVYEAVQNPADPRHEIAIAIIQAQRRMLDACRAAGVKAVLPVGYQIQMGSTWNESYPDSIRRDAEGRLLDIYGGGVSASFYSPQYQQDIESYYRWVDDEFVRPYEDMILMLNLADEPLGGDYSAAAEAEFRQRHGFGFDGVGEDPERQRLLGEFQSRYIVEYAAYSAGLWQDLHPELPVTMSFDGAQARMTFTMPDVEALFRDTPSNFVVTFDAYPRDGLPHISLDDKNLVGLFLLARSLGLYSAQYDRKVWLWAAANSWGLSQASPDPGTVSDAVSNGLYLALLVRQAGGDLQGIAYWNYNVKEQGLYNDTHAPAYTPDAMFERVSAQFGTLRRLMAGKASQPRVLLLAPPAVSYQQIGAHREAVRLEVQPFRRLAILAKEGINAAVVSSLEGWPLAGVRAIVILSPDVASLSSEDSATLKEFLARGGKAVTSPEVGETLAEVAGGSPALAYRGLVQKQGSLYVAQKGIAVLFEDGRHEILSGFWREVLGLKVPQPGYRVIADDVAFHYHLGPDPVQVQVGTPYPVMGYLYDDEARPVERIMAGDQAFTLGHREYALVQRISRRPPQRR